MRYSFFCTVDPISEGSDCRGSEYRYSQPRQSDPSLIRTPHSQNLYSNSMEYIL